MDRLLGAAGELGAAGSPLSAVVIHTDLLSSYGWTARLIATEKGVNYSIAHVGRGSPEIRRHHPFGKMPVLQHGDVIVYETLAIAHYIDRAFAGPALQPVGYRGQSEVLRWISVFENYVFPLMKGLIQERSAPTWRGDKPDEVALAGMRAPLAMQLGLIDETVRGHAFLVGQSLTLADCFLFPILHLASFTPEGAEALVAAPAASQWLARMRARPSFAVTNPFAPATPREVGADG